MAVIETTRSHASAGFIGQTLTKITAFITEWNSTRITRNALSRLSDRELEDIGLSRSDIASIGIQH